MFLEKNIGIQKETNQFPNDLMDKNVFIGTDVI